MALTVGDIWPQGSGLAALGAEFTNGGSTGEVRPFAGVHANSGIYYGSHGSSGIIRYENGRLQKSDDGGRTFKSLVGDLNDAYQGGNRITQNATAAGPDSLSSNFFVDYVPALIRQTIPGGGKDDLPAEQQDIAAASIVASGFSLTPNLLRTFAYAALGPGYIALQGSGTVASPQLAGRLLLGASNNGAFGASTAIISSGVMFVTSNGDTIWTQQGGGDLLFLGQGNSGGQIKLQPFGGSGRLEYRLGGVGGHQAWHWKPSYAIAGGPNNDGFFPLPHSGQIVQMILENAPAGGGLTSLTDGTTPATGPSVLFQDFNGIAIEVVDPQTINFDVDIRGVNGIGVTQSGPGLSVINGAALSGLVTGSSSLQGAYNGGASIYMSNGNMILNAVNGKTVFGTNGARAPLNMSGIFQKFTSNLAAGDLTLLTHNSVHLDVTKSTNPTTQAQANAQSLGPNTLQFNNGSGLINISTGSGIAQFFNVVPQAINANPNGVTFFEVGNNVRDRHFHAPNNASGIVIMTPGLYRGTYSIGVEKTAGTTAMSVITYMVKNNIEVLGSRSYAVVNNITNAVFNTANANFLFDAVPGDVVALAAYTATTVIGNSIQLAGRSTNFCLEYIGPRRVTQSTLVGP